MSAAEWKAVECGAVWRVLYISKGVKRVGYNEFKTQQKAFDEIESLIWDGVEPTYWPKLVEHDSSNLGQAPFIVPDRQA